MNQTPLPPLAPAAMRLVYVRNHAPETARVDILAGPEAADRVVASITLAPFSAAPWRGKLANILDLRVTVGEASAFARFGVARSVAQFEVLVGLEEDGAVRCVAQADAPAVAPGRVTTLAELAGGDQLRAASAFVPGGLAPVRPGAAYTVPEPAEVICPEPVRAACPYDLATLFGAGERRIQPFHVGALQGGRVLGEAHLSVFGSADLMLKEQQNLALMLRDPAYRSWIDSPDLSRLEIQSPALVRRRARQVDMPVFVLGNGMAWNYGHWLMDLIPRFLALESVRRADELHILLPRRSLVLDLWREAFDFFGVDRKRAVFFDELAGGAQLLQFPEVIFPGLQHIELWEGGIAPAPAMREVFERLRRPLRARPPTRRVYVSRREANTRRMENEEALCALLRGHGFEIVVGETLSLRQKLALFAETKVIAGLMGSNLANCVMMPPGGLVLEFFGADYMLDALRPVAAVSGHRYAAVIGTNVGDLPRRRKNIEAPLDALASRLGALLRLAA